MRSYQGQPDDASAASVLCAPVREHTTSVTQTGRFRRSAQAWHAGSIARLPRCPITNSPRVWQAGPITNSPRVWQADIITHSSRARRGVTLIELVVVLIMIGVAMAIVVPRFRVSPGMQVRGAAQVLVQDMELVRTRALASRTFVMMQFDETNHRYDAYMDVNGDSAFVLSQAEVDSLRVFRGRALDPGVRFSTGSASVGLMGTMLSSAVALENSRVVLSSRGTTDPSGTEGVIYLAHADAPEHVSAVRIAPSGAFEVWVWRGDHWE